MQALVLLQQRCMYVHPSVCPSHFGIMVVYKNNKKRHDFFTDGEPIRSLVLAHSLSGSSRNSKGVTPSEGVKWKFACSYLRMCYFRPLRHRISDRCKIGQVFIDPCYELQKVPRNPTFHKKVEICIGRATAYERNWPRNYGHYAHVTVVQGC